MTHSPNDWIPNTKYFTIDLDEEEETGALAIFNKLF